MAKIYSSELYLTHLKALFSIGPKRVSTYENVTIFGGTGKGFCYFGPDKYVMPEDYKSYVDEIRNMDIKSDDLWVLGAPRNGTTWTRAMVWLINNDLDYKSATENPLKYRFPWLEKRLFNKEKRDEVPSPRHIFSHLLFSLLPEKILDKCKIIFVARNPKDVIVSHYHASKSFCTLSYTGDFQTFMDLYINDQVLRTHYFPRLKCAWAQRNHPNMLFLFYEDMLRDFKTSAQRVATFLDKDYTEEQIEALCVYLKFDNMKNSSAFASSINPGTEEFFRKGEIGDWKKHFDEEMSKKVDKWIRDNVAGTDIIIPDF